MLQKQQRPFLFFGPSSPLRCVGGVFALLVATVMLLPPSTCIGGVAAAAAGATSASVATDATDLLSAPEDAFLLCAFDTCQCSATLREMACRGAGFTRLPSPLPPTLEKLDIASNNITDIPEGAFSVLANLTELVLTDNILEHIHPGAFRGLHHLRKLSLQNCGLHQVPRAALAKLSQLTSLNLDQNWLEALPAHSLSGLSRLETLTLAANRLTAPPSEALRPLHALRELSLSSNQLTVILGDAFPALPNLTKLVLRRNQITTIEEQAFANVGSLTVLELDDNLLMQLPIALSYLPLLQELSLSGNRLSYVPADILQRCKALTRLELKGNPLKGVHPQAFSSLPALRKLFLSDSRELKMFPALNGTSALEELYLDRSSLASVPASLCHTCPNLRSLVMKSNSLTEVPLLDGCNELRLLDLASNRIADLEGRSFRHLVKLHDLMLSHNAIIFLPEDAFHGLENLQRLDLESNKINDIHPRTFTPFNKLQDLNVGNNVFPQLPALGVGQLLHLKAFNNPALREFPPPESFPRIQTLVLSYAYHCCAFLPLLQTEPAPTPAVVETIIYPGKELDMSLWNSSTTDVWPQMHNMTKKFGSQMNHIWDKFGNDFTYPGALPTDEYFEDQDGHMLGSDAPPKKVQCLPLPGPFLPCQDLFDWWTLRCGVWIVFLLAMLGNGTVVFVLIFSRSKMDVPRFLVCNLAAADFFMGIYLGFLAVVDASTLGEFRMYAIPWQMSAGCQLAGFLGVLSSELSVYTLAVITLERNYAITHAMHLNKRLSLKHAGYIMACGWSFALVMALLPLLGVSDYRKFAVCLPFETTGAASLAYVVFLMFINGVAFLILMGCYLKMYCAIRGSQAWNSNDSRIAKRMALLVFTDFVCWSPIAFFSLTAAFGLQLVSLEQAKVFTVFVLPLNSCCNPFLYAILTKQFKKDCVLICKAIEESRVTRGIGRCRHSSNFSNRQTPANTNSLVDRSSREHGGHHPQQCTCSAKLLGDSGAGSGSGRGSGSGAAGRGSSSSGAGAAAGGSSRRAPRAWLLDKAGWLLLCLQRDVDSRHRARSDQYAYQIAEIQQKQHKRASSVSSSENFSSSRSDSWRQHHHHCGIPLRLLDPKRRASSWLVTRKTSQDSNLSSSRNDSSGSATTASTSTWRMSRSSASSDARACAQAAVLASERAPLTGMLCTQVALQHAAAAAAVVAAEPGAGPAAAAATAAAVRGRVKPRLTRQSAVVQEDCCLLEPSSSASTSSAVVVPMSAGAAAAAESSPGRLTVRFLATIPSAAETSVAAEEEESCVAAAAVGEEVEEAAAAPFYAILHATPPHTTIVPRRSSLTAAAAAAVAPAPVPAAGEVTVHRPPPESVSASAPLLPAQRVPSHQQPATLSPSAPLSSATPRFATSPTATTPIPASSKQQSQQLPPSTGS